MTQQKRPSFLEKRSQKVLAALGLVLALVRPAIAETRSVDASFWAVAGNNILLRVIEPDREWARLPGTNGAPITVDELGQYVLTHFGARSAGGDCPAIDLGFDIGRITPMTYTAGERRYEMMLRCPSSQNIVLIDHALFTESADHNDEAQVSINNQPSVRQVFTAAHQQIALPAPPVAAGYDFAAGFRHFWLEPDHLLLVLGIFALCGLGRPLIYAGLGGLAGFALSLLLAASGLLEPALAHGEWMIGFLLALLAAELAGRHSARVPAVFAIAMLGVSLLAAARGLPVVLPVTGALLGTGYLRLRRLMPDAVYLWAIPAAVFGLAEGLTYWPDLALLGRPGSTPLALFDAGAAAGCLGLWLICRAATRIRFAQRSSWAAVALAGVGCFLVVTRL